MKKCNSCDTRKKESEFGKRAASKDGLSPKCKTCMKVYDRARNKDAHRAEARAIYAQSDEGKITSNKAKYAYRKRNPNKEKAHAVVSRAIRAGNLVRLPCEKCGSTKDVVAHHDDYKVALQIRWLCTKHHVGWHDKNGPGKNP